jgi:DNA-directed RNA polymerase omega subunit
MESIYLPIENEFVNTQSRYRLAILVAQRTRQLIDGDAPTVASKYTKPTSIALVDILKGNLEILYGKEAIKHQDDAARIRKERKSRYLSPEREEELRREIKKDLHVYVADASAREGAVKEEGRPAEVAN